MSAPVQFKWLGQPPFPDRGVPASREEIAQFDQWWARDPRFLRWVMRGEYRVGVDIYCPSFSPTTTGAFIERGYFEVPQRYGFSTISGVHWMKYVLWSVLTNCYPPVPLPPPPYRRPPVLRAPPRRPALRAPPSRCQPGDTYDPQTGLCYPQRPVTFVRPSDAPLIATTLRGGIGQPLQAVNFEQGKRYTIEYLYTGQPCSAIDTLPADRVVVGSLDATGLGFNQVSPTVIMERAPNECLVVLQVTRADETTLFNIPNGPLSAVPNATLDRIRDENGNTLYQVCPPNETWSFPDVQCVCAVAGETRNPVTGICGAQPVPAEPAAPTQAPARKRSAMSWVVGIGVLGLAALALTRTGRAL